MVSELFPEPIVKVEGSPYVQVVLTRTADARLAVHLINTAGPHADPSVYVYDHVPPIGPLSVTIRAEHRPEAIESYPQRRQVAFAYNDRCIRLTVPRLDLYDTLVLS